MTLTPGSPTLPGPVVDASWLADQILAGADGGLVVADVRWYLDGRSARAAYDAGHIPGAVFVDLDTELADPATQPGGRHPLPAPERFAAAMGRLGIGDARPVVAYDDSGGITAARLWWMLRVLDHPVAVLDGGIGAWTGPLTTTVPTPTPASFTPRPWPAARFLTADGIAAALAAGATVLDARDGARYRGDANPIDTRFGHIPGARSAPCRDNLDPATGGLRDTAALAARYEALGALDEAPVVAYCGSGVSACHDLLALEVLGRTDAALYTGSWSDWGADPTRPVATGGT